MLTGVEVTGLIQWLGFALGVILLIITWRSIIVTIVQPRVVNDTIAWLTWSAVKRIFLLVARRLPGYAQKDALLALLAPVGLLSLLLTWLSAFLVGYALIFWRLVDGSLADGFRLAGSSLFTLGYAYTARGPAVAVTFVAGATGMVVIALQIGYLPAIYSAYSRREALVTALTLRAGAPTWGPEILARHAQPKARSTLVPLYAQWEGWCADIVESHASYPWLIAFRSPNPLQSWVIGLLAMLDTAALDLALSPDDAPPEARYLLQAGITTFKRVHEVTRGRPSILTMLENNQAKQMRENFPEVQLPFERFAFGVQHAQSAGFPMTTTTEEAWTIFSGWRAQYEEMAYSVANEVLAAPAPWSGPREQMSRREVFDVYTERTQPPAPLAPEAQVDSVEELEAREEAAREQRQEEEAPTGPASSSAPAEHGSQPATPRHSPHDQPDAARRVSRAPVSRASEPQGQPPRRQSKHRSAAPATSQGPQSVT